MPIDSSIYNMIRQPQMGPGPMEQYGQMLSIKNLIGQDDMRQRQLQEYDRKNQRTMSLQSLLAQGGPDVEGQLLRGGFLDESLKYGKGQRENRGADAKAGKDEQETLSKALDTQRSFLDGVNTPQAAAQWLAASYQHPLIGPVISKIRPLEEAVASIPQDPQGFRDWALKNRAGLEKFAADQRAREQQTETGRHNRASEATAAGNLRVAQGNLDNSRQRLDFERTQGKAPAGYRFDMSGNLEAIPGGPATVKATSSDTERVSAGYASRMAQSGKILEDLEKKNVGKPEWLETAASAGYGGLGKMASNAVMSGDRQKYRQAQEDWVRAKLRKESGAVIADEEMDREIRVYFPQIGDEPDTVTQKAQSRKIAEQAMTQAAGRAPVDQGQPSQPEVRKTVNGKNYVKRNGQWFEE